MPISDASPTNDAPLGVFDSGLGGLTVVHALRQVVPHESIIYLGDTARVPYGTRSPATVERYARGCSRVLIDRGVKALIIACNTASAVAVDVLTEELDVPVLGVVEPGANAAVAVVEALGLARAPAAHAAHAAHPATATERLTVGVLGTVGTISSQAYPAAVHRRSRAIDVVGAPAPLLVPLVEEGWVEGEVPRLAIRRYIEPLLKSGASVLVLGCTHYPLLKTLIAEVAEEIAGTRIPIVDSAEATALEVATWLRDGTLPPASAGARPSLQLLVTDRPASFSEMARRFLSEPLPDAELVDIVVVSA